MLNLCMFIAMPSNRSALTGAIIPVLVSSTSVVGCRILLNMRGVHVEMHDPQRSPVVFDRPVANGEVATEMNDMRHGSGGRSGEALKSSGFISRADEVGASQMSAGANDDSQRAASPNSTYKHERCASEWTAPEDWQCRTGGSEHI